MKLVCVHGWGLSPTFWLPLSERLTQHEFHFIDLGFVGPVEHRLPEGEFVFMTHSLGTLWALSHLRVQTKALIILNGFSRFCRAEDFKEGVDPRIIARMIRQIERSPETVWHDFMKKAGDPFPVWSDDFKKDALKDGLKTLQETDHRATLEAFCGKTLVIGGQKDHIVAPSHSRACFKDQIHLIDDGDHLLAQSKPDLLVQTLSPFLDQLT